VREKFNFPKNFMIIFNINEHLQVKQKVLVSDMKMRTTKGVKKRREKEKKNHSIM
jgi:hypothetical protein